jgi:eukaryotic-like serine/threonine-protein kinase
MSSADTTRPRALLAAGATIGAYHVLAPLAAGAMGEVDRARDTRLGRDVALKLLPASRTHDESARDLAEREARIVASLNHPNIFALHDGPGETDVMTTILKADPPELPVTGAEGVTP